MQGHLWGERGEAARPPLRGERAEGTWGGEAGPTPLGDDDDDDDDHDHDDASPGAPSNTHHLQWRCQSCCCQLRGCPWSCSSCQAPRPRRTGGGIKKREKGSRRRMSEMGTDMQEKKEVGAVAGGRRGRGR